MKTTLDRINELKQNIISSGRHTEDEISKFMESIKNYDEDVQYLKLICIDC